LTTDSVNSATARSICWSVATRGEEAHNVLSGSNNEQPLLEAAVMVEINFQEGKVFVCQTPDFFR
jgi:hypothetical protein